MEIISEAIERLEQRSWVLRELADDFMVQVAMVRGIVHVWAQEGASEIDTSMAAIHDVRELLDSVLEQSRGRVEATLNEAHSRLSRPERDLKYDGSLFPEDFVKTAKLVKVSADEDEAEAEKVPLPSKPPPEPPAAQILDSPLDFEQEQTPGPRTTEEDLATFLERSTWQVVDVSRDDEELTDEESDTKELSTPCSRPAMPVTRANRPVEQSRSEGSWEEDFSQLLEGGSWLPQGSDSGQGGRRSRRRTNPKATLENILSGYLKDRD